MASIKFEAQPTKSFNSKSICGFASKLSDRKLKLHNIKSRKHNYKNKQENKCNIYKKEEFKRSVLRKQDRKFKEKLLQFTDDFEHQNINVSIYGYYENGKFVDDYDAHSDYSSDEFYSFYDKYDDCSSISSSNTTIEFSLPNYNSDLDDFMD